MTYKKQNKDNTKNGPQENVCPYCGQSSQTVFVHGHEQCVFCKSNVAPCCQGEFGEQNCTDNYNW